ncbi:MAG: hypothetical protein HC875_36795 [Anaerolineales bacterium]|nr:hypothetical protein [Anaerolineales bacterium]
MGIERYLGFHFTETCIYIAEAYVGRDKHLHWDVMEQANYELEPEWLALYKDAIPNLYDTEKKVFGFAALPSIWRDFSYNRFLRFNSRFFEKIAQRKSSDDDQQKLANLFRYCQSSHIRPQPDETLVATLVVEQLSSEDRTAIEQTLKQLSKKAKLEFIDVTEPEEACLRYLWYEDVHQQLEVEHKMVVLVHLGYSRTFMIPWDHGKLNDQTTMAPGMLEIDRAVAMHAGRTGMSKTVGQDELLLYAQRARRGFDPDQNSVKILDAELETPIYLNIIQEQVTEISRRLERLLRNLKHWSRPVDEVLLAGEGIEFAPVRDALQSASQGIPMRFLPQPTYAMARGAASKSWKARNRDVELR